MTNRSRSGDQRRSRSGRSRRRTVFRPSPAIRSCCTQDSFVRVVWWNTTAATLERTMNERLGVDIELAMSKLAERVPLRTDEDLLIHDFWPTKRSLAPECVGTRCSRRFELPDPAPSAAPLSSRLTRAAISVEEAGRHPARARATRMGARSLSVSSQRPRARRSTASSSSIVKRAQGTASRRRKPIGSPETSLTP